MPFQRNKMQYVRLGDSALKVSKVIMGCLSFGNKWQPWLLSQEKALPVLKYAYDNGITTFDMADTYSNGETERIFGAFLKHYDIPRHKVVILSKCFFHVADEDAPVAADTQAINDGNQVNQVGLSRKHIFDAVEASVLRLGTYIDVLQIHRLDREASPKEIMRALSDVVDSGKARYIGASSMKAWEFQRLQNTAAKHGWHQFVSMQGLYNLVYREEEHEMIPYCEASGVGYIPWSPLASGLLAHPWDDKSDPREQSDIFLKLFFRDGATEVEKRIVETVQALAEKKGVSMAQVALAWIMSKGTMPITGLETEERIDQAIQAVSVELSSDEIKQLEEPYRPKAIIGY